MSPTNHTPSVCARPDDGDAARPAAAFDQMHAARASTGLVAELYAEAMGEDYPCEVAASSSCDWPLLGLLVRRLRMPPSGLLVDAGCGTGGVGLWLARALHARLLGLDLSPVAVYAATTRRAAFGLADDADFRVADLRNLRDTDVEPGCADAVVCVDALGATGNRRAALHEMARLLAPGARLAITRALQANAEPGWRCDAEDAGLILEHIDERPAEPATWQRVYRLWISREHQLRAELGHAATEAMLAEARRTLPRLPGRRAVLLTLRRPSLSVPAAATMPPPHPGHSRPHGERTTT